MTEYSADIIDSARTVMQFNMQVMSVMTSFNMRLMALTVKNEEGLEDWKIDTRLWIKRQMNVVQRWADQEQNQKQTIEFGHLYQESLTIIAVYKVLLCKLDEDLLSPVLLHTLPHQVSYHR